MRNTISKQDDVIDSRDIIKRIEELEEERTDLADALEQAEEDVAEAFGDDLKPTQQARDKAAQAVADWDASDEAEELRTLKALAEQCEGYGDWEYGETLIARSYFQTYAQKLAADIGAIDLSASWPLNCIDWEQAAKELEADYMAVDFDGEEFLMRA
jgi:bacterioferritin (cytochrome b1)